jgi:putative hemolysin
MNQKGFAPILIVLIFSAIFVVAGAGYWYSVGNKKAVQKEVACTMEAKLCPDGSSVGRSGPNCEFAPCPEENTAQLANPASVYCEKQGGKLEIRTGTDGSQTGFCKLSDGSECEEWAYFRGECVGTAPKEPEQPGAEEATKKMIYSDEYIHSALENPTLSISDWKIYKNTQYGFQISYPPGYVVTQEHTDSVQFVDEKYLKIEGERPSLMINVRQNSGSVSIDNWFKQNSKLYSGNFPIESRAISSIIPLTVSQQTARVIVLQGMGEVLITVLVNGNSVLDVEALTQGSFLTNRTLLEQYAASLQSIRFIEK